MTSRNEFTGDLLKSKNLSDQGKENHVNLFGDRVQRGRYKQDKETRKFIPINEWNQKYSEAPKSRGPMIICNNFDPFISMVTGERITNKREHQYDMESTDSRVYEGREQETKEAQRHKLAEIDDLENAIEDDMMGTYHDIEHGHLTPSEESKPLIWDYAADE